MKEELNIKEVAPSVNFLARGEIFETPLGVSNINRYFTLSDRSNGPTVIIRSCYTNTSYLGGFSSTESDGISVGDYGAAVDTTITPADAPLYAITDYAKMVQADVWPVLLNLFATGTGSRREISFSEFVRYTAMWLWSYRQLYFIVQLNTLAYHYDWTKVAPFSDVVPQQIYDLAAIFDATDVGLNNRWLPLMERLGTMVAFPNLIKDTQRMLTPMLSIDLNGRLLFPTPSGNPFADPDAADNIYNQVDEKLGYIETTNADAGAIMTTFLPFPAASMPLWQVSSVPVVDVPRETGWFNSGVRSISPFGDTGDPDETECLIYNKVEGAVFADPVVPFFTRLAQPTWDEVAMTSIFELETRDLDDVYRQITPHGYANVIIADDAGGYIVYDGTAFANDSEESAYVNFVDSRFAEGDIPFGRQTPGFLGSGVPWSAAMRLLRQQMHSDFALSAIKAVLANATGGSLREIRQSIQYIARNMS